MPRIASPAGKSGATGLETRVRALTKGRIRGDRLPKLQTSPNPWVCGPKPTGFAGLSPVIGPTTFPQTPQTHTKEMAGKAGRTSWGRQTKGGRCHLS